MTDLHVGGDIMWVVGDTLMLWPMIPVALRWMHMDERKAARIDRELDAAARSQSRQPASSGRILGRGGLVGASAVRGPCAHRSADPALRLRAPATRRRRPPRRASCRTVPSPTSR